MVLMCHVAIAFTAVRRHVIMDIISYTVQLLYIYCLV